MPETKARADRVDTRLLRQLAAILNETGLSEIEVEREGLRIRVARTIQAATVLAQAPPTFAPAYAPPSPAPAAATPSTPATGAAPAGEVVNSPMVGTVYLQPSPGAPAFAAPGDPVTEGQTLLLVEAMKTMNPIVAPRSGILIEYLVADAQPVEYGEPLLVIG